MKNILDVFGRDEQFATVLMVAFTDFYGGYPLFGDPDDDEPNKRSWSPHTIALEIAQDSGGLRPENLDKLMAAAEISTTNHFSDNVSDFIRLCNILSDSPTDGTFDPAEPREIVWGIFESLIINGGLEPLSNEIKGYITAAINESGLSEVPLFLRYVVPELADKFNTTITTDPGMFEHLEVLRVYYLQSLLNPEGATQSYMTAALHSFIRTLSQTLNTSPEEISAGINTLLEQSAYDLRATNTTNTALLPSLEQRIIGYANPTPRPYASVS